MADVLVYSQPNCGYCVKAKQWLDDRDIAYEEFNVAADKEKRKEFMEKFPGARSVPQIEAHGVWIGGFDKLEENNGEKIMGVISEATK